MLNSDYLLNLNEKQQEAVLHLDGPLLILFIKTNMAYTII